MKLRFGGYGCGSIPVMKFKDIVAFIDNNPRVKNFSLACKGRLGRQITVRFWRFKSRKELESIVKATIKFIDKKIG